LQRFAAALKALDGGGLIGTTVDFLYDNALNSLFFTPAVISVGFENDSYQGLPLLLPNNPGFLGQEFYFLGLHLEVTQGLGWAALSNAVGVRIGDQ